MAETIQKGWLETRDGDKFAPATLVENVYTRSGKAYDERVREYVDQIQTNTTQQIEIKFNSIDTIVAVDENYDGNVELRSYIPAEDDGVNDIEIDDTLSKTGAAADAKAVGTALSNKAAASHNHAASNITSGTFSTDRLPTIPISKGGTGATTAEEALVNLGITASVTELNKLDGITATVSELNYVDGVTSNIQTQLNSKQATITGGASTITSSNLTTSRALISNSSGKVAVSPVTATELGYLDGTTSNVQSQLDTKATTEYVDEKIASIYVVSATAPSDTSVLWIKPIE